MGRVHPEEPFASIVGLGCAEGGAAGSRFHKIKFGKPVPEAFESPKGAAGAAISRAIQMQGALNPFVKRQSIKDLLAGEIIDFLKRCKAQHSDGVLGWRSAVLAARAGQGFSREAGKDLAPKDMRPGILQPFANFQSFRLIGKSGGRLAAVILMADHFGALAE